MLLDTTLVSLLGLSKVSRLHLHNFRMLCLSAFNNASNSRGHRNKQERASLLTGTSKETTCFLKYLKTSPSIHFHPLTLGSQGAVNESRQEPLFLPCKLFFFFYLWLFELVCFSSHMWFVLFLYFLKKDYYHFHLLAKYTVFNFS